MKVRLLLVKILLNLKRNGKNEKSIMNIMIFIILISNGYSHGQTLI